MLSRTDPALLIKLFEQEVPEIYDGTVMIRGAVREAGDRAKVAVYSRERDVDPVGACVGMKGTRVQAIIRELRGEKIDIVEWSDDPVVFVTNALSPAKVQRVTIVDDGDRVMEVVVEDKQLSLAIGKKGQNVRLAAKLTGWRIDIKSEEEKRREVEEQFGALGGEDENGRGARGDGEARRGEGCRGDAGRGRHDRAEGESRPRASGRGRVEAVEPVEAEREEREAVDAASESADDERSRWPPRTPRKRARAAAAPTIETAEVGTRRRNQFGNGPDLQGRGTARHDEPGSAGAAEARSRHRAEERVEHASKRSSRGRSSSAWRVSATSRCLAATCSPSTRCRRRAGRRRRPPRRPEPPKPAAPVLGPPRLVKSSGRATPAVAEADAPPESEPTTPGAGRGTDAAAAAAVEPVEEPVIVAGRRRHPRLNRRQRRRRRPRSRKRPPWPRPPEPVEEPAGVEEPAVEAPRHRRCGRRATVAAAGRFVPPTIRLRIEEPGRLPQPARPLAPAKRPQVSQPRIVQPPPAQPPVSARSGRAGRKRHAREPARRAAASRASRVRPIRRRRVRRRRACSAVHGRCRRSRSARSPAARPVCRASRAPRPPFGQRAADGTAAARPAAGADAARAAVGAVDAVGAGCAAADHAHHHARRRHDGEGPGRQARRPRQGRARQAVDEAHDDDHQQHARRRDRQGHRARVRRRDRDAELRRGARLGRGRRVEA